MARACSQVDEGIEAMLCCWLQQLQEFGGPEVEKPDLLQLGSVNSLKPYLQAAGGNVPRHTFFKDPRARYNVSIPSVANNCILDILTRFRVILLRFSFSKTPLELLPSLQISIYFNELIYFDDKRN